MLYALLFGLLYAVITGNDAFGGDSGMQTDGFFEGDIAGIGIHPDRNTIIQYDQLWPEGIVPYEIASELEADKAAIYRAFEHYHIQTCIKFRPKTDQDYDYIRIERRQGCWSAIGRLGGKQILSLDWDCVSGMTIAHELAHSLGFWHEHSRSDRDDYVEVLWENIEEGQAHNFEKKDYYFTNRLNESFDYASIMMYDSTSFSVDRQSPTLKAKQPGIDLIPTFYKNDFSPADVRKINKLYQCFGNKRPDSPLPPPQVCTFNEDLCGIENQKSSMGIYFGRNTTTLDGKTGTFLTISSLSFDENFAQLTTQFYEAYGRYTACFSFDMLTIGSGLQTLTVMAQGHNNQLLVDLHSTQGKWKTYQFDVNVRPTTTRFFLTPTFKNPATVALDNLRWSINACSSV